MNYRRNNKRFSVAGRGEYLSTSDFIVKYYTNLDACRKFFFDMKWPTGYYCENADVLTITSWNQRIAIVVLIANTMKEPENQPDIFAWNSV